MRTKVDLELNFAGQKLGFVPYRPQSSKISKRPKFVKSA
jgi:hypothetical protein